MIFSFDFSLPVWLLLALMLLAVIVGSWVGLKNMRSFARRGTRVFDAEAEEAAELPKATVIVYAKNAEQTISPWLKTVLSQDYPDFEVIVVNDASIDNTAEIVETLMENEPRLRYSFVPDSSRNVSRRKVALTIGAKGATGDVLVMVNAHSEIPSGEWLRRMAAPFADSGVEVVLGASVYPFERQNGAGRWYREFDSLLTLSQWMGSALADAPYRGDAYSLAIRRSTFFDNNGFALTNRFVAGEDDIFINSIATAQNTRLAFRRDALVVRDLPQSEYPRLWLREKERYAFTARYLDTWALRRQALVSLCQWMVLGCGVAAAIVAWPNLAAATVALLLLLFMWGYEICLYRRSAKLVGSVRLFWSVPLFLLFRPLAGALMRIRFRANKAYNYTWKHPK